MPQMVTLYRDPDGDTVFTAHNNALEIQTISASQHATKLDTESDVDVLKQRIKVLEDQLKATATVHIKPLLQYNVPFNC